MDGKPLGFDDTMLHQNPWVEQKVGGPLILRDGQRRLHWDFAEWTRTVLPN